MTSLATLPEITHDAFEKVHGDLISALSLHSRFPEDGGVKHVAEVLLNALTEQRSDLRAKCSRSAPRTSR